MSCGSRRITLVEDQVQHGEHGANALRQFRGRRHAVGDLRCRNLALGAREALRHRRLGREERARDVARLKPRDEPERERDLRLESKRGVAAREHEAQLVVLHRVVQTLRNLPAPGRVPCHRRQAAPRPRSVTWREPSRRITSMLRFLAVVTIQPAGDGGIPSRGHTSSARTKASCTASSAASMLPSIRTSVATARPRSRRKASAATSAAAVRRWLQVFGDVRLERSQLPRRSGAQLRSARAHSRALPPMPAQSMIHIATQVPAQMRPRSANRPIRHPRRRGTSVTATSDRGSPRPRAKTHRRRASRSRCVECSVRLTQTGAHVALGG